MVVIGSLIIALLLAFGVAWLVRRQQSRGSGCGPMAALGRWFRSGIRSGGGGGGAKPSRSFLGRTSSSPYEHFLDEHAVSSSATMSGSPGLSGPHASGSGWPSATVSVQQACDGEWGRDQVKVGETGRVDRAQSSAVKPHVGQQALTSSVCWPLQVVNRSPTGPSLAGGLPVSSSGPRSHIEMNAI